MATSNYVALTPAGYQSTTATSATAISLTVAAASAASAASASLSRSNYCVIIPETAGIRWRDDGVAAVNATTGGMPLAAGQAMGYDGPPSALSLISQAGTATIHVSYYRTA